MKQQLLQTTVWVIITKHLYILQATELLSLYFVFWHLYTLWNWQIETLNKYQSEHRETLQRVEADVSWDKWSLWDLVCLRHSSDLFLSASTWMSSAFLKTSPFPHCSLNPPFFQWNLSAAAVLSLFVPDFINVCSTLYNFSYKQHKTMDSGLEHKKKVFFKDFAKISKIMGSLCQ